MKHLTLIFICLLSGNQLFAQKLQNYLTDPTKGVVNITNRDAQARINEHKLGANTAIKNTICPTDGIFQGKYLTQAVLLSDPTLNRIFAKKISYYLSGEENLSLFKNYATANSSDGTITVGYNKARYKDGDDTKRLNGVTNIGLKGNLAELISESKFQNTIGIQLNHTIIGRGIVRYCISDAKNLIPFRNAIKASVLAKNQKELSDFDTFQAGVRMNIDPNDYTVFDAEVAKNRTKLENKTLFEKYKEEFSEEEEKASSYNDIRTNWVTISSYIPLNTTTQKVSNTAGDKTIDNYFFPIELGLTWSSFMERNKIEKNNYLFSFGIKGIWSNCFTYLEKYKKLDSEITETLELEKVEIEKETYYKGDFDGFPTLNVKPRILINNPHLEGFGKRVSYDLFIDANFSKYTIVNPGFGFLFSLPPADPAKPVNVGLTFTFQDITNDFVPSKTRLEKLKVGFTLTLPFNSIIY